MAYGYNDAGSSAPTAAAALTCWQTVRAAYPKALIVVCGPWMSPGQLATTLANRENVIKASFDSWTDPLSMFIRINTDPSPWVVGTGNVGNLKGDGNADWDIQSDGVHPSKTAGNGNGQWMLARRFTQSFRTGLSALPYSRNGARRSSIAALHPFAPATRCGTPIVGMGRSGDLAAQISSKTDAMKRAELGSRARSPASARGAHPHRRPRSPRL
ncbi:hypothetical protein [Sphingomonas nostoxanthinifaciens]|uniref:hypothetical protein n=1 Tax=Sphingomonas nostoxanthinifaciens TaxID=2872652 RepID=UPI001CC1F854|nr:hypothetical protein [Sphingomonas nostoxanthinifaciens]UAK25659.1 hypothetical protein K8P63_05805 [Sphingomonas nostoxanthinifaciens]